MKRAKDCPDCKSKPIREKYERFGEGDFIECSNDNCDNIVFGRNLNEAIESWNKL